MSMSTPEENMSTSLRSFGMQKVVSSRYTIAKQHMDSCPILAYLLGSNLLP